VALRVHRLALAAVRALLMLRPRERRADGALPRVHVLLWNAWSLGGTVRTTLNVSAYLAREREVTLLSVMRREGDDPFFEHPDGVAIELVEDGGPRNRFERLLSRRKSVLVHPGDRAHKKATLLTDLRLVRSLWGIRSGVVIGTRPALNLLAVAARRRGVAAIGWEHMHLSFHRPSLRADIARLYGRLDALVVLTEGDRRDYAEVLGGAAPVQTIPNAVPPMPGGHAPLTDPVILAAGRLTRQKAFARLIRAFALVADEMPEWTLRICGGGPLRRRLRGRIAQHGLEDRVVLAGRRPRMWEEMERASMFALSSRFEGFPMVLVEAMSKGLPIVAFDCPTGPREVVRDGKTGFLVPNDDEPALAARMLQLARDERLRSELGRQAAVDARRYSLEAIGPRWEALIASVAERDARAAPYVAPDVIPED
jgi:glycosyltransferase involved in cell wall biosynthesis